LELSRDDAVCPVRRQAGAEADQPGFEYWQLSRLQTLRDWFYEYLKGGEKNSNREGIQSRLSEYWFNQPNPINLG
jgi:hypothetical protein